MYHARFIIPGLIIFVVLIMFPFWYNLATPSYAKPELKYPKDEKACVEPLEVIRAEHMQILDTWRDSVVRDANRIYTASDGKKWNMSLQNTCMDCHANKAEFCDKCHETTGVDPYCWTCHLEPKGNE